MHCVRANPDDVIVCTVVRSVETFANGGFAWGKPGYDPPKPPEKPGWRGKKWVPSDGGIPHRNAVRTGWVGLSEFCPPATPPKAPRARARSILARSATLNEYSFTYRPDGLLRIVIIRR